MKKSITNKHKAAIFLLMIALLLSSCASPEEIGQAATSYPAPMLASVAEPSASEGSSSMQSLAQWASSEVSAAPVSSQASSAPASATSENMGGIPSGCVYTVEPNPTVSMSEPDPRREEYIANAEAYAKYLRDSLTLEDYADVNVYHTEVYIWMTNREVVEQVIAANPPPQDQFTLVKHQVDYTAKDLEDLANAIKRIVLNEGERLIVSITQAKVSLLYYSEDEESLRGKIEEQIAKHDVPEEQVHIAFDGMLPLPEGQNPAT